jgi:hypothetical protein
MGFGAPLAGNKSGERSVCCELIEIGATMGRRKPRVPFAYAVVPSVRLDSTDWSRIEREYGSDLSGNVRDKILSHTQFFVKLAVFENAAAPSEPAAKRLKDLRTSAQKLLRLVDPASCLPRNSAALYADELIGLHLYQKVLHPARNHEYLAPFAKEVQSFDNACWLALDEMNRTSKPGYWPSGVAWNDWIVNLTNTLSAHNLPISVRKDSDKNNTGRPSPFVRLIIELQNFVPKACHRYPTADAISQAIVRSRRVTKPESSPTQMSRQPEKK